MNLPKDIKKVLFVCTGNSCRSVMAEGLFKKMINDQSLSIDVSSAGVNAILGMGATEDTIHAMEKMGVNVASHSSQRIHPKLINEADLIVVMQKRHRDAILDVIPAADDKTYVLTQFGNTRDSDAKDGIPDPIGLGEAYYEHIGQVISKHLQSLMQKLRLS